MKKRNLLVTLLLAISLLITACGDGNPFVGTWTGKLDVTQQFVDGIVEHYPEMADYVVFDELSFVINIKFTNDEMSMSVDQTSIDTFNANFTAGMEAMGEAVLMDQLAAMDMTLEEAVAESGMDEEAYIEAKLEEMQIPEMTAAMDKITNETLAGLSKVQGSYTFDEENITIFYADETREDFAYKFDGDMLKLDIAGEGYTLHIDCVLQK